MRRALVSAALLAALLATPAAAWAPQGAPKHLRAARAGDARAHPGAVTEWWTLNAVDPRSRHFLVVEVKRDDTGTNVRVIVDAGPTRRGDEGFGGGRVRAGPGRLSASGPYGTLTLRGLRMRVASSQVTADLRMRAVRRGPVGLGWRLGSAIHYPYVRNTPETLNWAMLVATSVLRGSVRLYGGLDVNVDGWRASYEHGWGDWLLTDSEWDFLDESVIHESHRRAWVVFGLNRADTMTGFGAVDAQWLGLLARVDRRGVRICRPRIDRRAWVGDSVFERWATRLRLRCGGMDLRVRDAPPARTARRGASTARAVSYAEVRDRTATGRRRPGFVLHIVHADR